MSYTQNELDGYVRNYIWSKPKVEENKSINGKNYTQYTCVLTDSTTSTNKTLTYYASEPADKENQISSLTDGMITNQVYQIKYKTDTEDGLDPKTIPGYEAALNEWKSEHPGKTDEQPFTHFYKDANGKYCFMTKEEFQQMTSETSQGDNNYVTHYSYSETPRTSEITVTGRVEQSDSGRLSSITIDNAENTPENLKDKTFSITTTKVENEDAYEEAFNEYEYQKALYEQQIQEINAQTEIIQKQDQKLELRLKQLETEQSAISTEMDSVKNVIKGNVEKTFNTFG